MILEPFWIYMGYVVLYGVNDFCHENPSKFKTKIILSRVRVRFEYTILQNMLLFVIHFPDSGIMIGGRDCLDGTASSILKNQQ